MLSGIELLGMDWDWVVERQLLCVADHFCNSLQQHFDGIRLRKNRVDHEPVRLGYRKAARTDYRQIRVQFPQLAYEGRPVEHRHQHVGEYDGDLLRS